MLPYIGKEPLHSKHHVGIKNPRRFLAKIGVQSSKVTYTAFHSHITQQKSTVICFESRGRHLSTDSVRLSVGSQLTSANFKLSTTKTFVYILWHMPVAIKSATVVNTILMKFRSTRYVARIVALLPLYRTTKFTNTHFQNILLPL